MVYEFLLFYNFDVCLLQEVHLKDEGDVAVFTEEWRGGESAWSIGGYMGQELECYVEIKAYR